MSEPPYPPSLDEAKQSVSPSWRSIGQCSFPASVLTGKGTSSGSLHTPSTLRVTKRSLALRGLDVASRSDLKKIVFPSGVIHGSRSSPNRRGSTSVAGGAFTGMPMFTGVFHCPVSWLNVAM